MTTHRQRRCCHCGTRYSWQGSGGGCQEPLNDARYCPDCKQAIITALSGIPLKFYKVWVDTDEVTLDQLREWEGSAREENRQQYKSGDPIRYAIRSVYAPLFDLENPENTHHNGVVSGKGEFAGKTYRYGFWTNKGERVKPEETKVEVAVERNLETGVEIPWQSCTR